MAAPLSLKTGSIQIARPVREQLFARTVVTRSYLAHMRTVVTRSYDIWQHRMWIKHGWFRSAQNVNQAVHIIASTVALVQIIAREFRSTVSTLVKRCQLHTGSALIMQYIRNNYYQTASNISIINSFLINWFNYGLRLRQTETNELLSIMRSDLHPKLSPRQVHASWENIDCLPSQLHLLRLLQSKACWHLMLLSWPCSLYWRRRSS